MRDLGFIPDRGPRRRDPRTILAMARDKFTNIGPNALFTTRAGATQHQLGESQEVETARQRAMRMIRTRVEKLVWPYALLRDDTQHMVWGRIYKELDQRYGFDVYAAATKDLTPLDVVEDAGLMAELHAIARDVCV